MEKIKSVIINGKWYFNFLILYVGLGLSLSMVIGINLHYPIVGWCGLFIFFGCPALFQKQFRRGFTKKVNFNFSDDALEVETLNRITNELEKFDKINYRDIECFKAIDSSKDDSAFLRINLKNGASFVYTLLDQGNPKAGNINITDVVFKNFKNYNDLQENINAKITYKPNLFATKTGFNLIVCLTVLLVSSLIFQIIYLPKSIPVNFFMGLLLYIIIISQRKSDLEQSKRLI